MRWWRWIRARFRRAVAPRVKLVFNTHIFEGRIRKTITVRSDDPTQPLTNYVYEADVRPIFAFSPPAVDFGVLEPGKSVEHEVVLASTKRKKFAIKRIVCANPGLQVEISPSDRASSNYRLKVGFTPPQRPGPVCVRFIVETDEEKFPDPSLLVTGTVAGAVRVEPAALFLGMVRQGERFPPKTLTVRNAGPEHVVIRSVDPGDPALHATVTTNAPGREFRVDLTAREPLPAGWMRRTLRIFTSESDLPLEVAVSGVVRAAEGTTPR
ncbi:MAG: hypothetical protein N2689_00360 [Verrucomicrobiae bacterium]|nr:hypothetical protein [Verrucomicrobiae bacterium]